MSNYSLKTFNQTIQHERVSSFLSETLNTKKDTFVANATSLVANNLSLQSCEPSSIIYAALKATTLNLPLDSNLGFAYVIPYTKDKGKSTQTTLAQFQIGYKGLIQLAIRSGQYAKINITDIRDGEILNHDIATGEIEIKKYSDYNELQERNSKKIIGYMAYFKLTNGFEKYSYWCNEKIEEHAKKYSESYKYNSSVWKKNQIEMYSKTVLKSLLNKWGILSIELQDAIKSDQAIIKENSVEYVDNPDYSDNSEGNAKATSLLEQAFAPQEVQEDSTVTDDQARAEMLMQKDYNDLTAEEQAFVERYLRN